jgi:hypothetical protein
LQNLGLLLTLTEAVGSGGGVVGGGTVTGAAVAGGTVTAGATVVVVVVVVEVVDVVVVTNTVVDVDVVVGGLVVVVLTTLATFFFGLAAFSVVPTWEKPVTNRSTHESASASRPTDVPTAMRLRLRMRARCSGLPTSTLDPSAVSSSIQVTGVFTSASSQQYQATIDRYGRKRSPKPSSTFGVGGGSMP